MYMDFSTTLCFGNPLCHVQHNSSVDSEPLATSEFPFSVWQIGDEVCKMFIAYFNPVLDCPLHLQQYWVISIFYLLRCQHSIAAIENSCILTMHNLLKRE